MSEGWYVEMMEEKYHQRIDEVFEYNLFGMEE